MNLVQPAAVQFVRAGCPTKSTVAGRYVVVAEPGGEAGQQPLAPRPAESANGAGLPSPAAWRAVADGAPLLSAVSAAALACGLLTSDFSAWPIAWTALGILLTLAWSGVVTNHPARPRWLRSASRRQRAVSLFAIALMAWFMALPAMPSDRPPSPELDLLRHGAAALVAGGGLFVLAPLSRLAAVALGLLALQLFGAVLNGAAPAALESPLLWVLQAGFSIALAAGLGLAARQAWLRRARMQAELERRVAQAESTCQAALQADQDKTRFLSATSHDLRQPVHALGLFAATLDKRLHGTRDEPLVRNVVRSIEGLDRSLNAMLDVSRLDAGAVEPNFEHFPLRDLFRRLHMQFAGQADLAALTLRFSPGGKWLTSDPQLLERVLANLIQNAMKYTARGGVVVVARSTASHLNIEVWDTGVGIAASELPRVFDEYYQVPGHKALRQQGMGMGLSIVRRLVRLLGHRLTVASQLGRGTMFRLSIAAGGTPELQDLAPPADTQPTPAGRLRTVLIVEDDDAVREGLALLLEESGYAALQAASLEEARQTLRMLELPPDLLLTDLRLGDGPGGLEVIAEVRRACGFELPVVLITGDMVPEDAEQLGGGAYPVLFKPVDPRKLLLRIRSLVA